jgi:SAM-dependent methyltransferase
MLHGHAIFQALARPYEWITRTKAWEENCARMASWVPDGARHILDVGCGPGNSTVLLPRGTIGGDYALPMLRLCRSLPVVCLDATALPIRSASLDAATFHSVLYLLPSDSRCLSEVARSLRSGGRAILMEPQSGARATFLGMMHALPRPRWLLTASLWRAVSTFYGGYSHDELWQLLESAGLRVLRIEEVFGGLGLLAIAEKP